MLLQLSDVDKIFVANYYCEEAEDDTRKIVEELNQGNIMIDTAKITKQEESLNKAIKQLSDYDVILISDADEFILRSDRKELIENIGNKELGFMRVIDYLPNGKALMTRTHQPIVACRPDMRFVDARNSIYIAPAYHSDKFVHHFGYMDKQITEWKINNQWYHEDKETIKRIINSEQIDATVPKEIEDLINA